MYSGLSRTGLWIMNFFLASGVLHWRMWVLIRCSNSGRARGYGGGEGGGGREGRKKYMVSNEGEGWESGREVGRDWENKRERVGEGGPGRKRKKSRERKGERKEGRGKRREGNIEREEYTSHTYVPQSPQIPARPSHTGESTDGASKTPRTGWLHIIYTSLVCIMYTTYMHMIYVCMYISTPYI